MRTLNQKKLTKIGRESRMSATLPNMTIDRTAILKGITEAFDEGDLSFIETVNNITYGYKVRLKQNLTKLNDERKNQ